ncbi:hypothetical protein ASL14_08470 [Paenibacillus sp. IHB B 3084]|uniref:hypothetical protein n=1 Tax=Paenibacillus sp. IHB B 3084 TaxID=867076 RepID=UPI0007221B42|nr:hypothetical protein [Paenibacillus sp. IHB B 3084]ALP36196.1 hypothetical protein ASL14_08470 [Paenibacillus sp. IHB B 3084]
MKKFFSVFAVLALLLTIAPFGLVSAQEITTQVQSSNSIAQSGTPVTVDTYETNVISPQKANFYVDLSVQKYGGLLAKWTYKNPGKVITDVDLIMTLEYREDFLHAWKTVDTVRFDYPGGLGATEQNERTFYPDQKGTYRVFVSGNVYHTPGFTNIQMFSGSRAYDPKIIISNDPDKIELK